jgi:hypothetical protein
MESNVRTVEHILHNLPYQGKRPDGCSCLPISVFWKEILLLVEH